MSLWAIGEHHRHRVAATDPVRGPARGQRLHPLGVLPPGDLDIAAWGAERRGVATASRARLKSLAPSVGRRRTQMLWATRCGRGTGCHVEALLLGRAPVIRSSPSYGLLGPRSSDPR